MDVLETVGAILEEYAFNQNVIVYMDSLVVNANVCKNEFIQITLSPRRNLVWDWFCNCFSRKLKSFHWAFFEGIEVKGGPKKD